MKKLSIGLFVAAMALVAVTRSKAQTASPTKALSHFIHAVDDLDTTLAFYNNVFGLKGNPSDFTNPAVPLLTNAPRESRYGFPCWRCPAGCGSN